MVATLAVGNPQANAAESIKIDEKEYQETTYDELLNQIGSQTSSYKEQSYSAFDDVMVHAGFGYVTSFSTLSVKDEKMSRYQNGLQLSLGIDLFSPQWFSEGVFRNFGLTSYGREELSLREVDLKIGFKESLNHPWFYTVSTGLSDRYLKYNNPNKKYTLEENTASWMLSSGIFIQSNAHLSLGVELSGRTALTSSSVDQNSLDIAFRMNGHF
ncbi:MAG: hypothetical protein ACOYOK_10405 [Pseudobdellovibrionaceae bacterium]